MTHCPVHDPQPADYDSRGREDFLPTLEELEKCMSRHLASLTGPHSHFWRRVHAKIDGMCAECYEEMQIRQVGIEEVLLEEDYYEKLAREECTCPPGSPQTFYFLQSLRHAYKEAS